MKHLLFITLMGLAGVGLLFVSNRLPQKVVTSELPKQTTTPATKTQAAVPQAPEKLDGKEVVAPALSNAVDDVLPSQISESNPFFKVIDIAEGNSETTTQLSAKNPSEASQTSASSNKEALRVLSGILDQ